MMRTDVKLNMYKTHHNGAINIEDYENQVKTMNTLTQDGI